MAAFTIHSTTAGVMHTDGATLADVPTMVEGKGMVWMDLVHPGREEKAFFSDVLELDELVIEDVFGEATTTSLKFPGHRFFVVHAREISQRLDTETLRIIVKDDMLITVRKGTIPALATFARRLLNCDEEDIKLGVDFLLYELLDALADDWMPLIAQCSKELDDLELRVFDPETRYDNLLEGLHDLKRKLREANRSIESLNTITIRLLQPGERFINPDVKHYFSDLHQMTTALVKRMLAYSAAATSTRDSYLSSISMQLSESNAKLTEVMTTLTMVGATMLPLTLIAGIFGMNNDDLPADMFGGFWGILGLMVLFAFVMLTYFWRKGWFKNP